MTETEDSTSEKLKQLEAELKEEQAAELEKHNRDRMASRVAHLYEEHVHADYFKRRIDELLVSLHSFDVLGILNLGVTVVLAGLLFLNWPSNTEVPPEAAVVASEPTASIGSLVVGHAQGCLHWCTERELLVTRVLRNGCECVDDNGEPVVMTWAYESDKGSASRTKTNFKLCTEKRSPY